MARTVFSGGLVFDGTGASPRVMDIAIEGDRIVATGAGLTGDVRVDATGATILPGMFDCHVHVLGVEPKVADRLNEPFSFQFYNAISNLRKTAAGGVTTVRDCAGADLGLKQAVREGLIKGSRIQISITALSQTGGHMDGWTPSTMVVDPYYIPHPGRPASIADGVTGVRKAVRQTVRAGADFVKVLATHSGGARYDRTRYSVEELQAIGEEARAAGLPVVTHAYGSDAVKDAIRYAGTRSIEHLIDLDDEAIALMRDHGVWLVPTLTRLYRRVVETEANRREMLGHQDGGHDVRRQWEVAVDAFQRAQAAGVRMAMGTDTGNTDGRNLDELAAMQAAGMPAYAVLHAATLSSAELMGMDADLGSIEAGKLADLVVLDGVGVEDLTGLVERIRAVYKDGVLLHQRTA